MNKFFKIDEKLKQLANKSELESQEQFEKIEKIELHNQSKVLHAFLENKVSSTHFIETTGYGYNDSGREVIDQTFQQIFEAQNALVRCNFISGTHAIAVALFAVLKPNDTVLSTTGIPYDTIQTVFGLHKNQNDSKNLKNYGVKFKSIDLLPNAQFNFEKIEQTLAQQKIKLIYIQRSRGYETRPPVQISEIEKLVKFVKKLSPKTLIFVDNCYGEFVEEREPTAVGVNLICGSLIKNPGGAMATTGGYIIGDSNLVDLCSIELTAPGLGKEIGCNFNQNRNILMGIFLAPHVVANALKISVFVRRLFAKLNYNVFPKPNSATSDIVSTIELGNKATLLEFCKGIQTNSPIDSFLTPVGWRQPGYDSEIIMASGSFTSGSSIELSADAPIKPPYNVFLQGGLTFDSAKISILNAIQSLIDKKLVKM